MMRAGAILLLAFLAACGPQPAADGYKFETAEFDRDRIEVTIVQYDTNRDFLAAATVHMAGAEGLEAFAVVNLNSSVCEIHILRVATHYRPEWLGHELAHCMHGRWHP
jgi:hypothetical protein